MVQRNVELEARLIDDLLDLTRIATGKIQLAAAAVDVHAILLQIVENSRADLARKQLTVARALDARVHSVWGDTARLQQVFWNLIKNAIKFTPGGGEVRVVTSNNEPGKLMISVTDTGIGIDPDVLPKIFDAFEQGQISTQQFGGLGLGLAISQSIVTMHEGSIAVESAGRGLGTRFTVTFATCPAPAEHAKTVQPPRSTGALRLLLVEDHQSSREVLARILRRAGHEVHTAETAAQALQIAATEPGLHVVISDIGLPDQSGFALMTQLKEKYGLPGIALSGYGMEEDVRNARAAGFDAHLVKPVSFDRLRALLDQIAAGQTGLI